MNLNFNQVTYDGDLADADEEQLRSLVSDYEEAQEANAAEFKAAKETIDDLDDVDVSDFKSARSDLVEAITDYDSFEESPINEADLEDASFGKLREYDAYFAELDADDVSDSDTDASDDEADEFEDMGQKSPTHTEEDDAEFAEAYLGDLQGVNF